MTTRGDHAELPPSLYLYFGGTVTKCFKIQHQSVDILAMELEAAFSLWLKDDV